MKKVLKAAINFYQILFSSKIATCRYHPTCSQYALEAVEKHGAFKGSILAFKRVISCHPFSRRPIYDPV